MNALTTAGAPYAMPKLTLTRGTRRVRFIEQGRALVVARGSIAHKDLGVSIWRRARSVNRPAWRLISTFMISTCPRTVVSSCSNGSRIGPMLSCSTFHAAKGPHGVRRLMRRNISGGRSKRRSSSCGEAADRLTAQAKKLQSDGKRSLDVSKRRMKNPRTTSR